MIGKLKMIMIAEVRIVPKKTKRRKRRKRKRKSGGEVIQIVLLMAAKLISIRKNRKK